MAPATTPEHTPRRWRPQATVQLVHFSPGWMDAVLIGAIVDDGRVTRIKAAWTRIDFVDRWILAFADDRLDLPQNGFVVGQPETIPSWVTRPVAWVAARLPKAG